ncbi:MAG: sigma-70 family RNA polymerase sigma factor [Fimbriimonadaceae bacterium]|nr:sigma-70 family RNA polymerase sigma factor [Fimbriimonadaceae bacterium]
MIPSRSDDPLAPLLLEYARTRETAVRDEIVLSCMDLVEHLAARYRFTGEPVDDIAQEGYIGLINAVEMFDPRRGVKFTTYASHAVQGAIQHYLRDKGKLIREPGWLHDLNQKINKAINRLHQSLGREPTVEEIAEELSLPDAQIAEAVRARDVFRVSSLEQPAGEEQESGLAPADRDKVRALAEEGGEVPIVDRLALEEAMDRLRSVERQVVYDFFFNDLSKTEIARKLGYSISHVSHILRRALKELKDQLLVEERKEMRRQLRSIEGQLQHYVRRVEEETIKDELTGLFSRHYLLERLDEEFSRSRRYGHQLSVCLLAVQHLGGYVTQYGEPDGDRVLCLLADVLVECSRRIDRVGRYDDSRFLLLLPQTGAQATVLCRRIQEHFRALPLLREAAGQALQVACGMALWPAGGNTPDELLNGADVALRQALEGGGADGLVVWPETPPDD